jgi:hypothetical protein
MVIPLSAVVIIVLDMLILNTSPLAQGYLLILFTLVYSTNAAYCSIAALPMVALHSI